MKKILLFLLVIRTMTYAEDEQYSSLDFLLDNESIISQENRATPSTTKPKTIPVVNFSKPLIFNPNNTPYPTQPAQITDIRNLIVYVAGANENGPFGSSQNAINQINAINNNNIGFVNVMNLINLQNLIANQINNNQNNGNSTINPNIAVQQSLTQGAANQSASNQSAAQQSAVHANATSQLNINQNSNQVQNTNSNQTATNTNATTNTTTNPNQIPNFFANLTPNQITNQIALQLTSQNQSTTNLTAQQIATQLANQTNALSAAGIASSGINGSNFGGIKNTNLLNQISAMQTAMNNSTQAITQTNNSNQSSAASTTPITPLTQQPTVSNPNPFITLNDPVLTPKSVIWNSPLIIDSHNHFFDTQSTLVFQENIVFDPGANYTFPTDFVDYPAAIIINKSDITIDLNGFNLTLSSNSASNFLLNRPIHGISIMPGVQNVKIISSTQNVQTGSISKFSGFAVYGNGFSKAFSGALATSVYNIQENLIQNVLIENILMYANLGGISLTNVSQAFINLVAISYSTGNLDIYGINFSKVFNGIIINSKINQNYSNSDVIGIRFVDTISTNITNCLVDNNRSLHKNATGILITSTTGQISRDNKINNCSVTGNICGFVAGNQSIGIHLTGGSVCNLIQSCTAASNAYGAALIPPITNPDAYGIKIEDSLKNIINENIVAFHTTYGIIDTATISTSLFAKNICIFNTLNYSATVVTAPATSGPLPTTILYPGNLTAYTGGGPLWQNLDVRLT